MAGFNFKGDRSSSKSVDWDTIGKEPVKIANIMATRNYGMFKFIPGNRPVDNHFMLIVRMLKEVGILWCPVLINEKNEIVDGQHRFKALKFLNLPIIYVQQSGIGINEVRAMNSVASKWKEKDYVESYADGEEQIVDYKYLKNLKQAYPGVASRIYQMAITSNVGGGTISKKIREGEFECTAEQYEGAMKSMRVLKELKPYIDRIPGKKDYMCQAILFCLRCPEVDNEHLLRYFPQRVTSIDETATILGAITQIEDKVYNYQLRGLEPVGISGLYKSWARAKR